MAELRRCIGSERFGIAAHEAPITDFPAQPSQLGGLGRMCAEHWRAYTAGLARDAKARKAAAMSGEVSGTPVVTEETEAGTREASVTGPAVTEEAAPSEPAPKRPRRPKTPEPVVDGQEAAG